MDCTNEKDASEIIPNMWIGNFKAAYNPEFINKYNIKFIINASKTIANIFESKHNTPITYLTIPIDDKDMCFENLNKIYDKTNKFIYTALHNKVGVLIHCKNGKHISASIAVAFLIKYIKIDYLSAIIYINSIRKCSLISDTCMLHGLFKYYLINSQLLCKDAKCNCKSCANLINY